METCQVKCSVTTLQQQCHTQAVKWQHVCTHTAPTINTQCSCVHITKHITRTLHNVYPTATNGEESNQETIKVNEQYTWGTGHNPSLPHQARHSARASPHSSSRPSHPNMALPAPPSHTRGSLPSCCSPTPGDRLPAPPSIPHQGTQPSKAPPFAIGWILTVHCISVLAQACSSILAISMWFPATALCSAV